MKRVLVACLAAPLLSLPALAQTSKLDQAVARADQQLRAGKPADAVRTLGKAAESAGAAGQVALGRLQERLGEPDAAAAAYERARAVAQGLEKSDALAASAHFLLRRGRIREAAQMAQQAVAVTPSSAALAALARVQVLTLAESATALATAEQAVAADAVNGMAELARGEALLPLGRLEAAETALRRALELMPSSALAESRLALALIELKRTAEALAAARRASAHDERHGEVAATLALALIAVDPAKNWSEAISQAQTAATMLDPENAFVHLAVGRVFEAGGRLDNAVAAYRRAAQLDPESRLIRSALITASMETDARAETLAGIRADLAAGKAVPARALRLAGDDALRRGAWAEAVSYLQPAARERSEDAGLWALLARAWYSQARYGETADALRQSLLLAPQNAEVRATYGLVLGQTGDLESAERELLAVTRAPGYREAAGFANLGWVYRSLGKPAESIAAYRKALEIDPNQAQAALGLGWAYSAQKTWAEALGAYEQAMRSDPRTTGLACSGMAWVHAQHRDPAQARVALDRAKVAGVVDRRLDELVARLEQAQAEGRLLTPEQIDEIAREREREEARLRAIEKENARMQSKDPKVRSAAAKALAALAGADAVETLIYAMQLDADFGVRITATEALARLGSAAGKAVPHIEGILRQDQYEPPLNATPEQLQRGVDDYQYRKALTAALLRIKPGARVTSR